jgi:hypothetical protein
MKVYIITSGSYSDYGISAVFTDKAMADDYVAIANSRPGYTDNCAIEEWDSDMLHPYIERTRQGYKKYHVIMTRDGISKIDRIDSVGDKPDTRWQLGWERRFCTPALKVTCDTKSEEQAIKIANEIRAQLIALNIWLSDEQIPEGQRHWLMASSYKTKLEGIDLGEQENVR